MALGRRIQLGRAAVEAHLAYLESLAIGGEVLQVGCIAIERDASVLLRFIYGNLLSVRTYEVLRSVPILLMVTWSLLGGCLGEFVLPLNILKASSLPIWRFERVIHWQAAKERARRGHGYLGVPIPPFAAMPCVHPSHVGSRHRGLLHILQINEDLLPQVVHYRYWILVDVHFSAVGRSSVYDPAGSSLCSQVIAHGQVVVR